MIMRRVKRILFFILLVESIVLSLWVASSIHTSRAEYEKNVSHLKALHEIKKRDLKNQLAEELYLTTGKTVLDRIYNTRNQSILELLNRMTEESVPTDWKSSVKVDEFTKFIILIQAPGDVDDSTMNTLARSLMPMLSYCGEFVSNVAILDRKHVCRAFMDRYILTKVERSGVLSAEDTQRTKELAKSATRFNSLKIQCELINNHFYLSVNVVGDKSSANCMMMLDTGASISVIPRSLAQQTGSYNLISSPKRTFMTAKGKLTCSVIPRVILISGISNEQQVAVSDNNEISLLGMDFFIGKKFIVDSSEKAIYIWAND